jgi:glycosyltransferase involved in cell wall biosynthesis
MSAERLLLSIEPPLSKPRVAPRRDGDRPLIMIDGFNLALEKGTGVATYARNLSFALRDLDCSVGVLYGSSFSRRLPDLLKEIMFFDPPQSETTDWQLVTRKLRALVRATRSSAFEVPMTGAVVPTAFSSRLPYYDFIWNAPDVFLRANMQFSWFGSINRISVPRTPALCHWTYPLPIRVHGVPNIYTLHDLVPLRLPYTTLDKKASYLRLMRWICKTADHIVTVSENSKRDIVEMLGVSPDKVTNTYQAVTIPEAYRKKADEAVRREIEGTFGLKYKEYFLFFGSLEPKKNIGRMIQGFLASGVPAPLVVVGAQAWKSEQELALLGAEKVRAQIVPKQQQPARKVVQLEYAPFPLLVSLIRGAKATLFPSLYEGFGLPVLESMLLGTPVLTSNTSSIPEIVGDAALLVNPYDGSAIAEGIRTLDSDADLRADLSARGHKQVRKFAPERYTERLMRVYDDLLPASHAARVAG